MPPTPLDTHAFRIRPRRRGRRSAFTLIELLTVIAIIGILAAILIPVVGKVRDSARTAQCSSNMRSMGIAARAFGDENRDMAPNWNGQPVLENGRPVSWYLQLVPYLGGKFDGAGSVRAALRTMVCPSSERSRSGETDVPWLGLNNWGGWPYVSDYGYNVRVNPYPAIQGQRFLRRFNEPKVPSQTPLIHELVSQNNFYAGVFDIPRPESDAAALASGQRQAFTQRHNGGGFVLWFDGHISKLKYDEYMAMARNNTNPWLFLGGGFN